MNKSNITFIGGGNMAFSLIGGLIAGNCPGSNIHVSDPNQEGLASLTQQFGIQPFHANNKGAIEGADAIVLAVKPQILAEVATEIGPMIQDQTNAPLVISIAAGIREGDLQRWLGGEQAIVRTMPNTPALLQSGATALYANRHVNEPQKNLAESILRAVGTTVWLDDEAQLDAVTALSGSGPAYFFLFMEAMEAAGQSLGLSAENARRLTTQTAFGAAKMALERPESSAELRQKVTSPGGTTEKAIGIFQQQGLEALVSTAMQAAQQRSIELADLLGQDNNPQESS
jgi:pyrroline-5-carboxylate reductase